VDPTAPGVVERVPGTEAEPAGPDTGARAAAAVSDVLEPAGWEARAAGSVRGRAMGSERSGRGWVTRKSPSYAKRFWRAGSVTWRRLLTTVPESARRPTTWASMRCCASLAADASSPDDGNGERGRRWAGTMGSGAAADGATPEVDAPGAVAPRWRLTADRPASRARSARAYQRRARAYQRTARAFQRACSNRQRAHAGCCLGRSNRHSLHPCLIRLGDRRRAGRRLRSERTARAGRRRRGLRSRAWWVAGVRYCGLAGPRGRAPGIRWTPSFRRRAATGHSI
jgi:hypothetical protein